MSILDQYKEALKLRGQTQRKIKAAEKALRKTHDDFGAASELVAQTAQKLREELGMGTFKLGKGLVVIIHAGGVQVQELKRASH